MTWRLLIVHALAAIFVVINWATFIWASIHGHVLERGIGHLLAPFVAIAVGTLTLGDKTSPIRSIALVTIAAVVFYLLESGGDLRHWVYVTIGISWGGYACLKKWTTLDSFSGLLTETAVLAMFIPLVLLIFPISLRLPSEMSYAQLILLGLCGIVSVIPLAFFAFAASRLTLSVMGFFQFVLPLTQLFVALAIYRQPTSLSTLICFSIIGLSLVLMVTSPFLRARQHKANKI
jgi:chloramphenicol-sensitive protein RarD